MKQTLQLSVLALGVLIVIFASAADANATSDVQWAKRTSMPTGREGPLVAALGDTIYVAGGGPGVCTFTDVLEAYDQPSDSWQTLTPMNNARSGGGAAAIGGTVYAVGGAFKCGAGSQAVDTGVLEEYDPGTNMWTVRTPMPTPRRELGVTAVNGKLYAFGGTGGPVGSDPLSAAEVYDPSSDSWSALPSMPAAAGLASAATVGKKIYVLNGGTGALYEFDTVSNTWATKTSAPANRTRPATVSLLGKIFVIGGFRSGGYLDDLDVYDPTSDTWKTIAPSAVPWFTARESLGGAVVSDKIYVVGGAEAGSPPYLTQNEEASIGTVGGFTTGLGGTGETPLDAADSSGVNSGLVATSAAAVAVVLGGVGWYARRRGR